MLRLIPQALPTMSNPMLAQYQIQTLASLTKSAANTRSASTQFSVASRSCARSPAVLTVSSHNTTRPIIRDFSIFKTKKQLWIPK